MNGIEFAYEMPYKHVVFMQFCYSDTKKAGEIMFEIQITSYK